MKHILILEDDETLCRGIALALQGDGIAAEQCHTLAGAVAALAKGTFDLGIFDINLPDGSGLDLLRRVRGAGGMPVILLTARDTEMDIVSGLESGADDYITKPFSLAVLRARVNTQLRRTETRLGSVYTQGPLAFDFGRMEYRRDGQLLELSKTEQKLLRILVENRGLTVPRSRLLEAVWPDGTDYVDENALSVTIKRLRDKLEAVPARPRCIKTVYGVGYQWVAVHE